MMTAERRIVLVARSEPWLRACRKALGEKGIEAVEAYNCASAESAHAQHGGGAFVIDGELLCEFVSVDRPGPVLVLGPELPVVVFHADQLDAQHREAAQAHGAAMVGGDGVREIVQRVDGLLPPS